MWWTGQTSQKYILPHLPNAILPPDEHALYKYNFLTRNAFLAPKPALLFVLTKRSAGSSISLDIDIEWYSISFDIRTIFDQTRLNCFRHSHAPHQNLSTMGCSNQPMNYSGSHAQIKYAKIQRASFNCLLFKLKILEYREPNKRNKQ